MTTPVGDVVVNLTLVVALSDEALSGQLNMIFDYNVGGTHKGTGTAGFSGTYDHATSTLTGASKSSYPMTAGAVTLTAKSGTLTAVPAL